MILGEDLLFWVLWRSRLGLAVEPGTGGQSPWMPGPKSHIDMRILRSRSEAQDQKQCLVVSLSLYMPKFLIYSLVALLQGPHVAAMQRMICRILTFIYRLPYTLYHMSIYHIRTFWDPIEGIPFCSSRRPKAEPLKSPHLDATSTPKSSIVEPGLKKQHEV